MKNHKTKKLNKKFWKSLIVFGVVVLVFLISAKAGWAAEETVPDAKSLGEQFIGTGSNLLGGVIALVVGLIAALINTVVGRLTTLLIQILVSIAKFNGIIDVPVVVNGWIIIRDICNMFFIVLLLVIAFATILRYENYNYKKMLPKLLIMAVLINFSRMIFGLIIDAGQVVMLTFVNGFAQGHGYFIQMFNTNLLLKLKGGWKEKDEVFDNWATATASIMGVIAGIITLITIAVMLAMLAVRIVMLWIYTILSPLVFLGFAFPDMQKYTGKIWDDFIKQVMVGPVLAFFIWLALTSAEESTGQLMKQFGDKTNICAGVGAFFCDVNFMQFMMTIAFLMGGTTMASQLGGAAGGKAKEYAEKWTKGGLKWGGTKAWEKSRDNVLKPGLGVASGIDTAIGGWIDRKRGKNMFSGGLVKTSYKKTKDLASLSFMKNKTSSRIEANKALFEYNQARQNITDKYKQEDARKNVFSDFGYTEKKYRNSTRKEKDFIDMNIKLEESSIEKRKQEELDKVRLDYNGNKYKQDQETKEFYRVNKDGKPINDKDEEINMNEINSEGSFAARKSVFGKDNIKLTAMKDWQADFFKGQSGSRSLAWAAAKAATDEKITKEQKEIDNSGMTSSMMFSMLKDKSTSDSRRMALAMTLAIKEGFRGRTYEDVQLAKRSFGSNQILVNKFNDEVDKKFAHLNYNLKTDTGQAAFKDRLDAGKFDQLHSSAYGIPYVLRAFQDYHGKEFGTKMKRVMDSSKESKNILATGLDLTISNQPAIAADGNINPFRKAIVELTGDLGKAFRGSSPADLQAALTKWFFGANSKQIAKLSSDIFNETKMNASYGNGSMFIDTLKQSIRAAGLNSDKIDKISRAEGGSASNELIEKLKEVVD